MRPNRYVRAAILEAVENQLRDGEPPETRRTYDRLRASGISDAVARRLIGCVLMDEMCDMLEHHRAFDRARFTKALARLPKVPGDK